MKTALLVLSALCGAAFAFQGVVAPEITAVKAGEVKWEKAEGMPEGVMMAQIQGDMKTGPFLSFVKFPAGLKCPLHWHTANGAVVVVSGTLVIGEEGVPAEGKGKEVGPGGYFKVPSKARHWTWSKGETVFAYYGDAAHDMKNVEGNGETFPEEEQK